MGLSVLHSYKHTAQAWMWGGESPRSMAANSGERGKEGRMQEKEGRLTPPGEERKNQIPGYVAIQKVAGKAKKKVGYWTVVSHTH